MIWATVSFWSYFCWLYRASPSTYLTPFYICYVTISLSVCFITNNKLLWLYLFLILLFFNIGIRVKWLIHRTIVFWIWLYAYLYMLYIFIQLISVFISVYRTPFSHSSKAVLVAVNSFRFCLSGEIFLFLHF